MVIIGFDPGIGRTGWGVIKVEGSKNIPLEYGCIETRADQELPIRLVVIKKEVERLINKHNPDIVGVEDLFFNTNAKTALIVGQARGVIIATVAERDITVLSMTPLQIKVAITGYGHAEKDQMGKMVKMLLGLNAIPKPDDTADALACALACSFSHKIRSL